jgi:flagellar biogenesis protein FliO
MEAQHSHRRPGAPLPRGAAAHPGRALVLAGAILAALVLGDVAVAHGTSAAANPVTLPTTTAAITATPSRAQHATAPRPRPGVTRTPTRHASATPTVVATPDEAHTPVSLSDPLGSGTSLGADSPWWQSALDVAWKLALVVGLIYLLLRALAALKNKGVSFGGSKMAHVAKGGPRLLEPLEEIQLAPNHVLHAVRVGDRIFLIARTNGTLRALGEAEVGEGLAEESAPALPAAGFAGQLMRAWAGLMPQSSVAEAAPAALPKGDAPAPPSVDAVIDAKWSITPDAAPDPASDAAPVLPELPLRQGDARSGDEPPPLSAAEEREILWFAEEHGDSAAAKKFGLTRQRVTAMRVRYDRERAERPRRTKSATAPSVAAPAGPAPRRPAAPDHPRGTLAAEPSLPAAARTSQARAAYRQATAPVAPDVVSTPATSEETEAGAVTVGQILAARFGIKIP